MTQGERTQAEAGRISRLVNALQPFAALGGGMDMKAFHDLEDDVILYGNSGKWITAGDVRAARAAIAEATNTLAIISAAELIARRSLS